MDASTQVYPKSEPQLAQRNPCFPPHHSPPPITAALRCPTPLGLNLLSQTLTSLLLPASATVVFRRDTHMEPGKLHGSSPLADAAAEARAERWIMDGCITRLSRQAGRGIVIAQVGRCGVVSTD